MGGMLCEDGECPSWAFRSAALRGRPLLLHRTAKRALPALMQHYELTSIVAEAHADFVSARRWLERLGFHFEECLPGFAGTTETYAGYRLWAHRTEERRVGKGWVSTCRFRWAPYH